jgi:hypothetical protein
MKKKQNSVTTPSTICVFDHFYTPTQRLLSELALLKFRVYAFSGSHNNHLICLHRNEILPYLPFRNALYAIKTMATKSVMIVDLDGESNPVLYEGPLYCNVNYVGKLVGFETNPAIKPYWRDILNRTSILEIIPNHQ